MSPEYVVVVYKANVSPSSDYICLIHAKYSTLTWNVGVGTTVEKAIEEWHKYIISWEDQHPSFSEWPKPILEIPAEAVFHFRWSPKLKALKE